MTVLSWSLEFIVGCAIMIDYFCFGLSQSNDQKWLIIPNIFLCSIVIPSSYIIKTEAMKELVMRKGWGKLCTGFFSVRNSRDVRTENQ